MKFLNKKNCTQLSIVMLMSICLTACDKPENAPAKCEPEILQDKGTTTMNKVTLPSGLSYEILQEAAVDAQSPKEGKEVTVHYTGWLNENGQPGKKFDSSVDRGQQFKFKIGMGYVIPGWDEGVLGMKVGEKRRLYIPANLGYGARGAGASIPPHADLIFDVELFKVA